MEDLTVKDQSANVPAYIDFSGSSGFEGIDNECIAIPFLRLAQSNSPQATPGVDQIKGLIPGQYFNPSTGRIYGDEASFIILGFYRQFTVWHGLPPKAKFLRALAPADVPADVSMREVNGKNYLMDERGDRYVDTRNFFLLSADYPEDGILLYPMASTAIPYSKKWLAKASAVRVKDASGKLGPAPMWAKVWKLSTKFVDSDNGKYYQVSSIDDSGWIPESAVTVVKSAFAEVQSYNYSKISVAPEPSSSVSPADDQTF